MRQCFTPGGAVDYAAFDASFAQACVGESEDKLCRLAPGGLQARRTGDDARKDYELYLTAHPEAAFRRAIDDRDEAALRLLVAEPADSRCRGLLRPRRVERRGGGGG